LIQKRNNKQQSRIKNRSTQKIISMTIKKRILFIIVASLIVTTVFYSLTTVSTDTKVIGSIVLFCGSILSFTGLGLYIEKTKHLS